MLKFIGTGSAFNTKLGNNSAYIKEGNNLFLIDCGSANFHIMKESGFLDDVEHIHVYITHTHADHVGSLADLIFYMFYCKGEFKSRVTVLTRWENRVGQVLELNGILGEHYEMVRLVDSQRISLKAFGIEFLSFETDHVDEIHSFGIAMEIKTDKGVKHILYTGDTNDISYIDDEILEEVDYFYVDTCSQDYEGNVHLSLFKLHQAIKKEYRDKVWCMHLDEKFNKEQAKSLGFNVAEVEL